MGKDKVGLETAQSRVVKVDVTVDLVKEVNVERVQVTVKDVHAKFEGGKAQDYATAFGETVFSNDTMRKFLEHAISNKASEVATRMQNRRLNAAWAKIGLGKE